MLKTSGNMDKARIYKLVIILFFIALAIRVFLAFNTYMIGTDSTKFLNMAPDLHNGDVDKELEVTYHPLYPFLTSYFSYVTGDVELAAVIISILFGSLTVIPLFYLAYRLGNVKLAVFTLLLYAVHPVLVDIQSDVMTEGTFIFFFISAVALIWRSIEEGSWLTYVGGGFFSSLAYLTRVEGIILPVLFALFSIIALIRKDARFKRIICSFIFLILFIVTALPYLLWIHNTTGKWFFTVKGSAIMTTGAEVEMGNDSDDVRFDKINKGKQERYVDRFGRLGGIIIFSVETLFKAMHWVAVILLVVTIIFLIKKRSSIFSKNAIFILYIISFVICYFVGVVYGGYKGVPLSYRYFLPEVVLLLPFMVIGVTEVVLLFKDRWSKLSVAIACLIVVLSLPKPRKPRRYESIGYREAAEWAKANKNNRPKVMATREQVFYYSDSLPAKMPPKYEDAVRMAKEKGIDYLIFSPERDKERLEDGFFDLVQNGGEFILEKEFPLSKSEKLYNVFVY